MKSSETSLELQAADELRSAGFVVGTEVPLPLNPRQRADIVAWISDEEGRLAPALVVECKKEGSAGDALSQLAVYANALGTARGFLFDGGWHSADDTFTRLSDSSPPTPSGISVRATDDETHSTFRRALWALASHLRDQGQKSDVVELFRHIDADTPTSSSSGVRLLDDLLRRVPGARVLQELREAIEQITGRSELAPTARVVSDALAALAAPHAGDLVEDPFAGFGSCLWSVQALADTNHISVRLRGSDLSPEMIHIAETLAKLAKLPVELTTEDFFTTERQLGPIVVTVPPLGLRSSSPRPLSFGGHTTDLDIAILDQMVQRLPASGRLVQVVPPKLLFAEGAAGRLRTHLSKSVRIVAIVELPAKVYGWTAVRSALIVIEKRSPSPTLVARLGEDWAQQLSHGGSFLDEYMAHLGAIP